MGRNLSTLNIKDTYEGLVQISGSILTDGTGSVIPSIEATASFATSASYATTATSASHALASDTSISASHSLNSDTAISSSYALTASFAENVIPIDTGSFVITASVIDATTTYTKGDGSTFTTLINNVSASISSSYATTALSASHAVNSDTAISASYALTSSYATTALSASHALASDTAISSSYALTASFAENVSTPTLQEVTTVGATTTNNMIIDGSAPDGDRKFTVKRNSGVPAIIQSTTTEAIFGTSGSLNSYTVRIRGGDQGASPNSRIHLDALNGVIINSGSLEVSGYILPTADGTVGQVVTTDGSGNLTFSTVTATTPDLQEVLIAGNISNKNIILENDIESSTQETNNTGSLLIGAQVSSSLNFPINDNVNVIVGGITADNIPYYTSRVSGSKDSLIFGSHQLSTYSGNVNVENITASVILASHNVEMGSSFGYSGTGSHEAIIASGLANIYGDARYSVILGSNNATIKGSNNPRNNNTIIGSQAATINLGIYNHIHASRDSYINTSYLNDVKIIGANTSNITNGTQNGIFGGEAHVISSGTGKANIFGGGTNTISGGSYPTILGGINNIISGGGSGATIVGSRASTMSNVSGTNEVCGIALGQQNQITSGYNDYCIGGRENVIQNRSTATFSNIIVGGYSNYLRGNNVSFNGMFAGSFNTIGADASATYSGSAIIAGKSNSILHNQSVIIGGTGLTTTKDDEVVVPNLTISGSAVGEVNVLTDVAGTTTMDCSLSNFFTLAMPSGGTTALTPSNIQAGQTISVKVTQNATAALLTFDSSIDFAGGTAFTISTGAGEIDVMTFISFDGTTLQATGINNFS